MTVTDTNFMWYLACYVGLAYLAGWVVDRVWWWHVDRVLKGKSGLKALTTVANWMTLSAAPTGPREPINSRGGARKCRRRTAFRRPASRTAAPELDLVQR